MLMRRSCARTADEIHVAAIGDSITAGSPWDDDPGDRLARGGGGGRSAAALHRPRRLREAHRRDRGLARRGGRRRRGARRPGRDQRHRAGPAGRRRRREPPRDDPARAGARPPRRGRERPPLEQRLAARRGADPRAERADRRDGRAGAPVPRDAGGPGAAGADARGVDDRGRPPVASRATAGSAG